MRRVAACSVLAVTLLLAGCGRESSRQAAARAAVEETLPAATYDVGATRCTGDPAPWFVERETTQYICAARRRSGGCDWYAATLKNAGWEVVLDRANAGCILPF
jgi:hypothetical protein